MAIFHGRCIGASWANLSNDVYYSGVATDSLTVTNAIAEMNSLRYRCIAGNDFGNATSSVATLTVRYIPIINVQPDNQSVVNGQNAVFTVSATANPAPTYRWQTSNNDGVWVALNNAAPYSGVTTTILTITTANVITGLNAA
jgi:hypothetical protein